MKAIPVVLLLCGTVGIGTCLGILYLKRSRLPPVLIGLHFLLGAAALEVFAMLLRGAPDGTILSPSGMVRLAAGCVAAAMISGLFVPLIGGVSRRTVNVALLAHVTIGAAGFLLLLAWALR